jgi:hypothetical protein
VAPTLSRPHQNNKPGTIPYGFRFEISLAVAAHAAGDDIAAGGFYGRIEPTFAAISAGLL